MKRPSPALAAALLALLATIPLSALTVSVAPAEDPATLQGQSGSSPMESLISGCLDSFFDAGLVATTAPMLQLDEEGWSDASFGLRGAKEGYVDYVVELYVSWKASALKKGVLLVSRCEYRVMRVSLGSVIASGFVQGDIDSPEAVADPQRSSRLVGVAVGKIGSELIRRGSNGGEG